MKKILTVIASFIIMLCIGSVYAWSIIASELIEGYGFSASQSQIIFGMIIAIFPVTMIFVGRLGDKMNHKFFGYISALLFSTGYLLASYSHGNFILVLLGIGFLSGIATGFGYWVSLTSPVQWFPEKKGLITGIAVAGFGLGAVLMSELSIIMLNNGYNVLELLRMIAFVYGLLIFALSNFIYQAQKKQTINAENAEETTKSMAFFSTSIFKKLFLGIFLGTFAGLLIIGSLKMIGSQFNIAENILVLGIILFAISNFLGRLTWGYLSDHWGASLCIFFALFVQSASILSLIVFSLSGTSYLILSFLIGFGFGGNFVLFAQETAHVYGLKHLGLVYPYVLLGYAIAGIAGPISGGYLFDISGSFFYAIILAGVMSLMGGLLFLNQFFTSKKNKISNQS
jgi:MFS transporter, OFA family, oxalate/formate antiporter